MTRRRAQRDSGQGQVLRPIFTRFGSAQERCVLRVTAPEHLDCTDEVGKRPQVVSELECVPGHDGREEILCSSAAFRRPGGQSLDSTDNAFEHTRPLVEPVNAGRH